MIPEVSRKVENSAERSSEKAVRIAFCIDSLDAGGAEKQLASLLTHLMDRGCEIQVYTVWRKGALLPQILDLGIPVYGCFEAHERSFKHALLSVKEKSVGIVRLYRQLRAFNPHLIQAWLPRSQALFMPLAALSGIRIRIANRRGSYSSYRRSLAGKLFLYYLNCLASNTTANSESEFREARQEFGRSRSPLVLVKNGINFVDERARPRSSPPRVVMLANFLSYKGHSDLVQAVALIDRNLRFCIELYGSGPERDKVADLIQALDLNSLVTIYDFTDDPLKVLEQAQLLVLPSHTEGLPNAILEAMAVGLPVVATEVGGVSSLISDGTNGLLVPPGNPEALARAMAFMVQNPELRKRMGDVNREKIVQYRWPIIVQQYERLHRDLVGPAVPE